MVSASRNGVEKPVIVLVPGSFSPPPFYAGIVDHLALQGFETTVVNLPSVGRRDPLPPATMAEDADFIQSVTSKLADEGKMMVMVTHSYGGICGTESTNGLSQPEREAAGRPGGIIRLVYLTSLVPRVGESLKTLMGDGVAGFLHMEDDYMSQIVHQTAVVNFSDIAPSEGLEWAKLMPQHSTVSFSGQLTHPGYKYIPVSYILCEEDQVIAPAVQQSMIDMMINEAGTAVEVHKLASGHCPNVSIPKTVARMIVKALRAKV